MRFALEGRPYDWSRFDSDEHARQQLALTGWTWAVAGKDGDGDGGARSFASSRGGAKVEVCDARHAGFCARTSSLRPQAAADLGVVRWKRRPVFFGWIGASDALSSMLN